MTIKATDIQISGLSYDFSKALFGIDYARADRDKSACTVFEGKIGGSYSPSATDSAACHWIIWGDVEPGIKVWTGKPGQLQLLGGGK